MTIDISKIKPGDEVTVRAVVLQTERAAEDQWRLRWPDYPDATLYAFAKHIVSHTPRALSVGDRVKTRDWRATFTIIAIDGEWAWLKDGDGARIQLDLASLERAQ